jgi:hypothetical protein
VNGKAMSSWPGANVKVQAPERASALALGRLPASR